MIDIKIPIGLMFSILGVLLTAYSFLTMSNADMYHKSLDININLYSGLFMLVFGGAMLLGSFIFAKKKNKE
ncbi:MAG: hypothetical protein Q8862_02950 [Bacteroidota bacterium]|nr:hypothetical protein [Bacteroidota bacterium]MDP4204942.1 hypothetical protein [Bacteroidota bacterium]